MFVVEDIHDIVGRKEDTNRKYVKYLVMYTGDSPEGYKLKWVKDDTLKEMQNPEFLIKKESLDYGVKDAVDIKLRDNIGYPIFAEFMTQFSSKSMSKYTPAWHGRDFYKGQTMRMVQKLLCRAKFPDGKTYYLVDWVNWKPFFPTWIEKEELLFFVKTCNELIAFDKYWDEINEKRINGNTFQAYERCNRKAKLYIEDFEDYDHDDFGILSYDSDNNVVDSDDGGFNVTDQKKRKIVTGTFHDDGYNVWKID